MDCIATDEDMVFDSKVYGVKNGIIAILINTLMIKMVRFAVIKDFDS